MADKWILNNDDVDESKGRDFHGQFCIRDAESLREDYRDAKWQLIYLTSGFGCDPNASGNGCFGFFCGDGEYARTERYEVLGIAKDEIVEEWKKRYGEPHINAD